jgi:hypothetical protein
LPTANVILADNFAPWVLASGIAADAVGPESATLRIPFSSSYAGSAGSCADRRC